MIPDNNNQQALADLDKAARNALQQIRQANRHVSQAVNQVDKATHRATRANAAVRRLETKYRKTVNKEYKFNQDFNKQKSKIPYGKMPPNHYQTLGLSKNASQEKIQKRVINILGNMPVKNGRIAERKREKIQSAISTLTNPETKSAYDKTLKEIRIAAAMAAKSKRLHKQVQRTKNRLESAKHHAKSTQAAVPSLKKELEAARKAAKEINQTAGKQIKGIKELKAQMELTASQAPKPDERSRRAAEQSRYNAYNTPGYTVKPSSQTRQAIDKPGEAEAQTENRTKYRR